MEKNLPFVSLSIADKGYNKWIIPFLGKLDDGNVFKNIINVLLSLSAIGLLVGGIYLSVDGLFGDDGFIKQYVTNENLTGGKKFGSTIGLLAGLLISLIAAWALFSVLKKRSEQLSHQEYVGLLDYVFNKTIAKLILVTGELIFILFLYGGVLQLVATLVGAYAYAPLASYPSLILGLLPGMEIFSDLFPRQVYGDYDNFTNYLQIGILSIGASFIILIAFYIYKEFYSYLLKLITNLIAFLPKFAIPLAIRKRNEN